MKIVIQRVSQASVSVDDKQVAAISKGMLLLVCMEKADSDKSKVDLQRVAQKIASLRIFSDPSTGKMNQDITQHEGEVLCVSQFTLSWDGKKGNRPSFDNSMEPQLAQEYFENFCHELQELVSVKRGVFGASMNVSLVNSGPVTFSLDF